MKPSRVRIAAEVGLTLALSAVLGLLVVWRMPQGGSISLVMLPLLILSLLRGPRVGMAAGALYGVLDFMINPYFLHPVQVVLDYPAAFAACGLAGLFAAGWASLAAEGRYGVAFVRSALPGIVVGALGRYAAHVLSGIVFFASYAKEAGQAPVVYSAIYNSFVLVSAALCAVIAAAVLPALHRTFIHQR